MTHAISTQSTLISNVVSNTFVISRPNKTMSADKAVDQAFSAFATRYPSWVDALFDQHFVDQHLKPVVKTNWKRGRSITALDDAMLWDAQFSDKNFDRRRQNLAELRDAAGLFISELKTRLR